MKGDIVVSDAFQMNAMFAGNVTVVAGGHLILNGTATKNVTCKTWGKLEVNGMVIGDLLDAGGEIALRGMVKGSRQQVKDH